MIWDFGIIEQLGDLRNLPYDRYIFYILSLTVTLSKIFALEKTAVAISEYEITIIKNTHEDCFFFYEMVEFF